MLRITRERLHPTAQLRLMHTEIERGLRIRDAPLLDQPHRLKLELTCKLPSLHDTPPVPSKHLTRCLRNRVQARSSASFFGRYVTKCRELQDFARSIPRPRPSVSPRYPSFRQGKGRVLSNARRPLALQ